MKKLNKGLALVVTAALTLALWPASPALQVEAEESGLITMRFDLGGEDIPDDEYIGVSGTEGYDEEKGYGFNDPEHAHDVTALGEGVLSDAVAFDFGNAHFKVKLPSGVYKITVTTGNVKSAVISAEDHAQLLFMTGNNAVDSFTIPVTDGYLNIYATSGVGNEFSISSIDIEQTSTGTVTKPTIWLCGDSTVASYYNVAEDAKRGWGEYLHNYVDTDTYDIRNISVSGIRSEKMRTSYFDVIEAYGKSGDILVLSHGINDYSDEYKDYELYGDPIDSSNYVNSMTAMVRSAKERGMTVYLVKENGDYNELKNYPLPEKKYFSDELDQIAESENVATIDLYRLWIIFCVEKSLVTASSFYSDGVHPNATGADYMASLVAGQLFPTDGQTWPSTSDACPAFTSSAKIIYETEPSGEIVTNPHKGYVMEVHNPNMLYPGKHPRGIDGSDGNKAWDVISVCCSVLFWEDLNPEEGVYNWEPIDTMLKACEQAGMTYAIRIIPYSTATGSDSNYGVEHDFVPQWVYDKGAKQDIATYKYRENSPKIKVPNWSDPIYIQAYKDFMTALAKRYDNNPRIEYIENRAFGNMGEWHTSEFIGNTMPSTELQKDMINHFASVFKNTTSSVFVGAREVYDYANSLGCAKRNDGLVMARNTEWTLAPSYRANIMTMGDNHNTYENMLKQDNGEYLKWTPEHYRECIEIAHLTFMAIDQDSGCGYTIYRDNKELIDEMSNKLGYNFTVTSAVRTGNKLKVTLKNTGLAAAFFDINLAAEITDEAGNKVSNFGKPILIEKGTFHDGDEKSYMFEYNGTIDEDSELCLAMYDVSNKSIGGENPSVRFDNKNTLSTNRLHLVASWTAPADSSDIIENYDTNTTTTTTTNNNTVTDYSNNIATNNTSNIDDNPNLGTGAEVGNNSNHDSDKDMGAAVQENENPATMYSNEWVDGRWYGEDGTQEYAGILSWKCNSTGWWTEDTYGWYPVSTWQKIDGVWYYFDSEGYMVSNAWQDGYWLSESGAWEYEPIGSWKCNSTGWWFEDSSGWYPVSQWQKINGSWYYFKSNGYLRTN